MLLARYAEDKATEHSTSIQVIVKPCSQAICRNCWSEIFAAAMGRTGPWSRAAGQCCCYF